MNGTIFPAEVAATIAGCERLPLSPLTEPILADDRRSRPLVEQQAIAAGAERIAVGLAEHGYMAAAERWFRYAAWEQEVCAL